MAEGLAWPVVEFLGDRVEVVLGVFGWVGALGGVLAQQAVGVLVGAAPPRGCGSQKQTRMSGLAPICLCRASSELVPGQRVAQEPGRVPHLADDGLLDLPASCRRAGAVYVIK